MDGSELKRDKNKDVDKDKDNKDVDKDKDNKDVDKDKDNKDVDKDKDNKDVDKDKKVVYYGALVNGWLSTRMELDKNILTLSSGAIGLLVTFVNIFGIKTDCQIILYVVATMGFLVSIISSLVIFKRNAQYLEKVLNDPNYTRDSFLDLLDKALVVSFMVGILSIILLSIVSISNYHKRKYMSEKNNLTYTNESFNNISNLNPSKIQERSFNNITNLKPKPNDNQNNVQTDNGKEKESNKK